MYKVITSRTRIRKLQNTLVKQFKRQSDEVRYPILGHQGGSWKEAVLYSKKFDIWFCGFESENRYWNAFGLGRPIDEVPANITCEVNFPFEDINRRIAGVFAEDEFGNEVVLHRGKIGGGRKGVGKSLFHDQYRGKYVNAADGEEETQFALVGFIHSENLVQQIASFVNEVHRIKNGDAETVIVPEFAFYEEFFGKKNVSGREATEAICNHGIIVNALASVLKERGFSIGNDRNRDLYTYSSGKLQNIFEIKPDSTNASLYSAIGQLIIYSIGNNARLFVVLPTGLNDSIVKKLNTVGIEIIEFYWDNEALRFIGIEKVTK